MKRLLNLAGAVVFSLFAGMGFVLPKLDAYFPASYYQVSVNPEDENYHALYSSVYHSNADSEESCKTERRQGTRESWLTITEAHSLNWDANLYEPVAADAAEITVRGDTITYTLIGEVDICAPAAGTINTSHYACDYGSTMEYLITFRDGSTYTLRISDAKCWYCCAHKAYPEGGKYTATTRESLCGQTMRVGDVLCVGKAGTTVSITRATSE